MQASGVEGARERLDAEMAQQMKDKRDTIIQVYGVPPEELGIVEHTMARPVQAATSSAAAFTVGSIVPLIAAFVAPTPSRIPVVLSVALVTLAVLGVVGATAGGSSRRVSIVRLIGGCVAAMGFTMLVGSIFGAVIA